MAFSYRPSAVGLRQDNLADSRELTAEGGILFSLNARINNIPPPTARPVPTFVRRAGLSESH